MLNNSLHNFFERYGKLDPSKIQEIAARFHEINISKNEVWSPEQEVSDRYLVLGDGFMRSYTYDVDGNDITTGFYAPGEVVFEVASFFNRTRSAENIVAVTDCHGWYITFKELNELFHALPEFREFGRHILVQGFSALKVRMLSMINQTAEQRYDALITHHPEIFKHAALKHIATYLGITDTSLSRIRKQYLKK